MLRRLFNLLMGVDALRNAQWFYKSEPKNFSAFTGNNVVCPACGAVATHQSDYPSRKRPFARETVMYCSACGLGFVPGMGPVLAEFYKQEYGNANRGDRDVLPAQYFDEIMSECDPALAKYVGRVRRQINLLKKYDATFGSVLDYGSGPGYFLQACAAQDAHAVEPDELSHKYLRYLGATIHLDPKTLPKNTFDTIVASHAIEHLPSEELHTTLAAMMAALATNGRILIEVPQGGHSYLHLSGQRQDPHTLFFTGNALVKALKAVGAKILFQQALGRVDSPRRADAIYSAEGAPFYSTQRGSLTVVCTAGPKT